MIDWLLQSSIWLSLLCGLLALSGQILNRYLGAELSYRMWMAVPLCFFVVFITENSNTAFNQANLIVNFKTNVHELNASLINFEWILLTLWFTGVVIFGVFLWLTNYQFFKRLSQYQLTDQEQVTSIIKHWPQSSQEPSVYQFSGAISPFVTGLIKPKLFLPSHFFVSISAEQQALVIQHEGVHWQRGDMFWNAIAQVIVLVFWFHPIVWLSYFKYRSSQELACDQRVLSKNDKSSRVAYANAMVQFASQREQIPLNLIHYGATNDIKQRIQFIATHQPQSWWQKALTVALVGAILSGTAWATATGPTKADGELQPVKIVEPLYPREAAEQNIEGSVTLEFDINTDGSVSNVSIFDSQPKGIFDENALLALKQWRYGTPAQKRSGEKVILQFRLDASRK